MDAADALPKKVDCWLTTRGDVVDARRPAVDARAAETQIPINSIENPDHKKVIFVEIGDNE